MFSCSAVTDSFRPHGLQHAGFPVLQHLRNLLKFMPIESVILSKHLILCCPLLLLPLIFPSIRVLTNESALCIRWLKYWSFSISPPNDYSGLISFKIDWFDLYEVQGSQESSLKVLYFHLSTNWPIFNVRLCIISLSFNLKYFLNIHFTFFFVP